MTLIKTLFRLVWQKELVTESDLGQRHKGESLHFQLRLLSALPAQLTLQYPSGCHCWHAHPWTPRSTGHASWLTVYPTPTPILSEWEEWSFGNMSMTHNWYLAEGVMRKHKVEQTTGRGRRPKSLTHLSNIGPVFLKCSRVGGTTFGFAGTAEPTTRGNSLQRSWDFTGQHMCKSFPTFPTALCHCVNFSFPFLVRHLPATPTWSCMQQQARMSQCVKNRES